MATHLFMWSEAPNRTYTFYQFHWTSYGWKEMLLQTINDRCFIRLILAKSIVRNFWCKTLFKVRTFWIDTHTEIFTKLGRHRGNYNRRWCASLEFGNQKYIFNDFEFRRMNQSKNRWDLLALKSIWMTLCSKLHWIAWEDFWWCIECMMHGIDSHWLHQHTEQLHSIFTWILQNCKIALTWFAKWFHFTRITLNVFSHS